MIVKCETCDAMFNNSTVRRCPLCFIPKRDLGSKESRTDKLKRDIREMRVEDIKDLRRAGSGHRHRKDAKYG